MTDPQSVVPESIMPKYAFMLDREIEGEHIEALLRTHRFVGVPYTDEQIEQARTDFMVQADPDGDWDGLVERYPGAVVSNFDGQPELTEMDAIIAYLQVLGTMVDFSTFTPDASR
jgi:cytochrome c oxidase cbb3-type subunit 2